MFQGLAIFWKAFSASCWLWKHFPCKKILRCLKKWWLVKRSGEYGRWAEPCSPISSTFKTLVLQCAVECCCEAELVSFCWPMLAAYVSLLSASHWFAEHTSQMWWFHWGSESCGGSDSQQINKQWPWPFLGQVWLWEVLWSCFLVQPLSWSLLVVVYNPFGLTSHPIEKWFVVAYKRRQHFRMKFFFFYCMRNPLIELLYLSSLLQMPNSCRMVDIEFLGNFSCSWKRIRFDDFLSWSL